MNDLRILLAASFHFVRPVEKENITTLHKALSVSAIRKSSKMLHKFFTHELTCTPDFKWQGWSNGGKNQNPKKSLDQNLSPKKSHAEFPSHNKNFQEA